MPSSNNYGRYHPHPSNSGDILPVILFWPSETDPLLPGKNRRIGTYKSFIYLLIIGALCLLVYQTIEHFRHCPPDPATRDAKRREWEDETARHALLQDEWKRKSQEQAQKEEHWRRDAARHEKEMGQRIREEHEWQEKVRREWAQETERQKREFEELQARQRREQERERERWQQEVPERDRLEEEDRQRRHMHWGNIEAHTCTTYATREYSAQLLNLPRDWKHPLDACKATTLEIHGVPRVPTTCEYKGPGVVIGRSQIDQLEPGCTTFWDSYNDKGCSSPGSGRKYITQKLVNLPEKSDWKEFCATTPAHFNHMQFPGAQECFTSMWGVYGQWEIDDGNC